MPADTVDLRLIGDIGGIWARFALLTPTGEMVTPRSLRCSEYPDFASTVRDYLRGATEYRVRHAGIAIANPVDGDHVRMTNYHWQFSIAQMRSELRLDTLVVVNDFTALAMSVPRLSPVDAKKFGGGEAREGSVIGVLGAGSGLGMSGLIPVDDGWVALATEGGHTTAAPRDSDEQRVCDYAATRYGHVSFERLLSASGISLIHEALNGGLKSTPDAVAIAERAINAGDRACQRTLDTFCGLLGTAASNLAVSLSARGGIYIGGGIVPAWGEYFLQSPFRKRFEDKGRFSDYVRAIPTFVLTAADATLRGVAAILDAQLKSVVNGREDDLLAKVRDSMESFSPAERRVAEFLLAQPRAMLTQPIADIAATANVSQPTVIRFCRTMGSAGLPDFKLQLAAALTGTIPVTHAKVSGLDAAAEVSDKVLSNTASAVLRQRDRLNREAIERAVELLAGAEHVEVFASADDALAAADLRRKLLRMGVPATARAESSEQRWAAALLKPSHVALFICSEAATPDLADAAAQAQAQGAQLVVMAPGGNALLRRANVGLVVEHGEDHTRQLPMLSRVLQLTLVDVLVVGLSLRLGGDRTNSAAIVGSVHTLPLGAEATSV